MGAPVTRPDPFSEEEVAAAMADSYVSLPIGDMAALAEAVNKCLVARYGDE